jgi:hypothetical protein
MAAASRPSLAEASGPVAHGAGGRAAGFARATRVDTTTFRALFKLSLTERAALVAGDVERLRPADIDEVLGSEPGHGVATLERARTRYAAAYAAAAGGADPPSERQGRRLTALRDASRAALGATAMAGR